MEISKIQISFLITHYNRLNDLKACISAIKALHVPNSEIVVSDDGSAEFVLKELESLPIDTLVKAKCNEGLAGNINKGLRACRGTYVVYCQEDFLLDAQIASILPECISVLETNQADIVRFTSNVVFKKVSALTDHINLIPKFSFQNFLMNYYQYSDHPFITKRSFYDTYGYYMEHTSGRYGESEFAIRMCCSKAKIAITKQTLASLVVGSESMLSIEPNVKQNNYKINKSVLKFARALRLYFEWVFYNKNKRGLITYKNGRKQLK